ncbi:hypothetical protein KDA_73430 [Dictyobacter alpinus]|uniref:MalT-like TPR region domain-containing protein n=1 Tax=Dictyobacter alpinus TaxID=2014873 RepID=A0A402BKJ8_9CHLR|nr:hypothetical protein [Dictyobacter alpinus]GCE31859.1 hypothetical protein KDA_73430 [Dictyobacter alpinus]
MASLLPDQQTLAAHISTLLLTLETTAQAYFQSGQLEPALEICQMGMQLIQRPETTATAQAQLKLVYGNMLAVKTNFENTPIEDALLVLEEAKVIAQKTDTPHLLADALQSIGYAHYMAASNKREGDPHLLLPYFQQALEHRRRLQDNRGMSESLFYVGLISDVLGQMETARTYYTQALQLAQQHNYPREAFEALRHLGFLEQVRGNLSQAHHYFAESLQQLEQANIYVYLPFAHIVLADVCLDQKNTDQASFHCQQACELAEEMHIQKAHIFALLTHGRICQSKQASEQAREAFAQAYAIAHTIKLTYAMQQASTAQQNLSSN